MLRTTVVLLVLCLITAIAGTAVTGLFWLSLVAVAAALVLGATALSLVRMPDDGLVEGGEADGGADVRPLTLSRRLPGTTATARGTGDLGRAA